MNRKWINEKDFVTDIAFYYTITLWQSVLWLPEENLSWFSVLPYNTKL